MLAHQPRGVSPPMKRNRKPPDKGPLGFAFLLLRTLCCLSSSSSFFRPGAGLCVAHFSETRHGKALLARHGAPDFLTSRNQSAPPLPGPYRHGGRAAQQAPPILDTQPACSRRNPMLHPSAVLLFLDKNGGGRYMVQAGQRLHCCKPSHSVAYSYHR